MFINKKCEAFLIRGSFELDHWHSLSQ